MLYLDTLSLQPLRFLFPQGESAPRKHRVPKDMHALTLEPVNVLLHGKRVFADAVKVVDLKVGRASKLFRRAQPSHVNS